MTPFDKHDVNYSRSKDFETGGGIRLRADIRCAIAVVIPREAFEDAGGAAAAIALESSIRERLVARLLDDPAAHMLRPGEFTKYEDFYTFIDSEETEGK